MKDDSTSIDMIGRPPTRAGAIMPARVRGVLLGVMAVLGAGAFYLLLVRGEALLHDLGALGRIVLCL